MDQNKQQAIDAIVEQLEKQNVPEVQKGSTVRLSCATHGDTVDGMIVKVNHEYAAAFCADCIHERGPLFLMLATNVVPAAYMKIVDRGDNVDDKTTPET